MITDGSGAAVETTAYMPFGTTRSHTGTDTTNYKFTDQELDPESGLYNYGARLYDPVIGRFISADTLVPDFSDPQSFDRYAYCRNNPLIYVDPSGHSWLSELKDSFSSIISNPGNLLKAALSGFAGGVAFVLSAGNPVIAGMVAGATAGALSGGGFEAIIVGAVTGGVLGGVGGFVYNTFGVPGAYAMLGAGVVASYATGGFEGLLYFAAGFAGGIAGYNSATYAIKQNWFGAPAAGKQDISPITSETEVQQEAKAFEKITRALTVDEKEALASYIPQEDLNNAILHIGEMPWYAPDWADGITIGNDIYFKPGAYDSTPAGLALLGHELVHVGQYRLGMTRVGYLLSLLGGYENSKYEIPAIAIQRKILFDLSNK